MPVQYKLVAMALGVITALAVLPAAAADAPPAGRWLAEDINGGGVIDRLQTTLEVSADGSVTGFGGCNRYMGKVTVTGATLSFGALAGTRKACTPAVMDQEQKFHAALQEAAGWRFDAQQNKLLLINAAGEAVVRLARL